MLAVFVFTIGFLTSASAAPGAHQPGIPRAPIGQQERATDSRWSRRALIAVKTLKCQLNAIYDCWTVFGIVAGCTQVQACTDGSYCVEPQIAPALATTPSCIVPQAVDEEQPCASATQRKVVLTLSDDLAITQLLACPPSGPHCVNLPCVNAEPGCVQGTCVAAADHVCLDSDATAYDQILAQWKLPPSDSNYVKPGTKGDASVEQGGQVLHGPSSQGWAGLQVAKDACKITNGPWLNEQACDAKGKLQSLPIDCRSLAPATTPPAQQPRCEVVTDTTSNQLGLARCVVAPDQDQDTVTDVLDNCPTIPNPDQLDSDADGLGDHVVTKSNDQEYYRSAINANGQLVAFSSEASDLVPNDKNSDSDVFLYDRATGATSLVSVNNDGVQANALSMWPSVSADGRFIAFDSNATNLSPLDANMFRDVYVRDRVSGKTILVSSNNNGKTGNSSSSTPDISADGRYVVFNSSATDLTPNDTNSENVVDVFVRDLNSGNVAKVNISLTGEQANFINGIITYNGHYPVISADGRFISFVAVSSNLVPNDNNNASDVFLTINPLWTPPSVKEN